jgi:hypothetical protein
MLSYDAANSQRYTSGLNNRPADCTDAAAALERNIAEVTADVALVLSGCRFVLIYLSLDLESKEEKHIRKVPDYDKQFDP